MLFWDENYVNKLLIGPKQVSFSVINHNKFSSQNNVPKYRTKGHPRRTQKYDEISNLFLTLRFRQILVAFSEYMNFKGFYIVAKSSPAAPQPRMLWNSLASLVLRIVYFGTH